MAITTTVVRFPDESATGGCGTGRVYPCTGAGRGMGCGTGTAARW
ncbi:hypothetical protein [Micromonospora echinofusca]|nr:hypothetical protein [Micromonospora echinofusca]